MLTWSIRARIIGVLLLAALLLFLLALKLARQPGEGIHVTVAGGSARVGAAAPDFTTQRLDGATVRLSRLRGKPVLLNFWATWCAPCQDEMPLLQQALDQYGDAGLTILAVDYQQTDTNGMQAFLRKVGARFPAVYDPSGQIAAEYGVTVGLPVSIFIDRSGTVEFIQVGQMSDALLQQHLHGIL
ncbi:MAG TPA: TlpA disulfide reductase family protein [Candidatus Binatus sp.]|nr:TlpA disulfide reductase family protein [Candidatus Binatus sp.]